MKQVQVLMSFLMSFLLVTATVGMEACGTKESTSASTAPQPVAASPTPQDPAAQQQAPAAQNAPAGQTAPADQAQQQAQLPEVNLTPAGLDELLAPIALYPDPVLAIITQASVDPQQVMDGGNWLALDENHNLKEAALDAASSKAGFTPVMQALLHYPTVVDMMCEQFDWTKQLGAAYQGNPKAVLDSVQRLRAQAVDTGALKSSPQMKVDVKQDNGQQVVELQPTDPKVVYVPQYNPDQVYSTTTTTTTSGGTTTTSTTTTGTPPASTNSTVVVQQEKSGVSTGSAVMIGLLSFGAGIALGAAINNNNYYYPSWGYGGIYYGGRPYYPPPYHPVYYGGWHGGYGYNRPPYYRNTNIYVNNSHNYYNRFNNNNNLNPNYRPKPVPYNNRPNSNYAKSMGNRPGGNQGSTYRPPNNGNNRPGQGNNQGRPGGANAGTLPSTRPATGNNQQRPGGANGGNNNWKGQTTYQGNKAGNQPGTRPGNGSTAPGRPSTMPGNTNAGANNRMAPNRNPSADRGYGQQGGARPSTGNTAGSRPTTTNKPAARPAPQQNSRPQSSGGGAFGGASNPKSDRSASNRGRQSMGAPAKQAPSRAPSGGNKKK
jgi:hypothetical protein